MTHRKLFVGSVFLLAVGFLWYKLTLNTVFFEDLYYRFDLEGAVLSMLFFPTVLSTLSIPFFFLQEKVFRAWWKFARVYVPIALVLILISSPDAGGGFAMDVGSGYDREGMVWFTSGLFFVISVILIAYKALKLKFSIGSK